MGKVSKVVIPHLLVLLHEPDCNTHRISPSIITLREGKKATTIIKEKEREGWMEDGRER